MKSKGKLANTLFFLSLLCIFVLGSVLNISYQIAGYKNIVQANETMDAIHTPLAYLQNKVRMYDKTASIHKIEVDGIDVLVLEESKANVYIYEARGFLCELYAAKNYQINLSDGDRLFAIQDFTFDFTQDGILFSVENENQKQQLVVAFKSKGVIV